ncbi:Inositol 1,3,4-trisphosphate 5/6-kinase 4-like protein [Drosera capensis]
MRIARLYSLESFKLDASPITDAVHKISAALGNIGGAVLFLVSDKKKDFFSDPCNNGLFLDPYNHRWLIVVLSSDAAIDATEISSISCIKKLEELPFIICHMNKKEIRGEIVTVGCIMKASRQADFAKVPCFSPHFYMLYKGAFPMYPKESRLMFVPLTSELPMMSQIKELDLVLHKATDEIVTIDLSSTSGALPKITYSNGLQQLRSYLEHQSSPLVIDPFDNIYPVLDRLKIQHVLLGLEDVNLKGHPRIRGPYFLKVFSSHGISYQLPFQSYVYWCIFVSDKWLPKRHVLMSTSLGLF